MEARERRKRRKKKKKIGKGRMKKRSIRPR